MFRVRIIGGYDGEYGSITAAKDIEIPFVPTTGLLLDMNLGLTRIWDDEIIWEMREGKQGGFTAHVSDFGDDESRHDIETWVDALIADGWEVIEKNEVVDSSK